MASGIRVHVQNDALLRTVPAARVVSILLLLAVVLTVADHRLERFRIEILGRLDFLFQILGTIDLDCMVLAFVSFQLLNHVIPRGLLLFRGGAVAAPSRQLNDRI